MSPTYLLLRHRLVRWLRDPTWGTGTVAGQAVILVLLLFLLLPLAGGSYALASVLRELYPNTDALRLINGGMLYLLPMLMVTRFLLQSPPSEQVTTYLALPIDRQDLLRGQAILPLMSVHTLLAVVMVTPLWATEVWASLPPTEAFAWLGATFLLAAVLPCLGAQGMQLLLGRRPKQFVKTLAGLTGLFAADVALGSNLVQAASRLTLGSPLAGLALLLAVSVGAYTGLLYLMQARLEIDRHSKPRSGKSRGWRQAFYLWVEWALPAGQLVAMELRQVIRTRRLRGISIHTLIAAICVHGWGIVSTSLISGGMESSYYLIAIAAGIGGPTLGLGTLIFGISHGYVGALFAHPHRSTEIVWGKLTMLWLGIIPGTLLLVGVCPWLPAPGAFFLLSTALWWGGLVVPASVWMGIYFRKPVDLSASHFSIKTDLQALPTLLLAFFPMVGFVFADITGEWWRVSVVISTVGIIGLCLLTWKIALFTWHLERHRHDMFEGFENNELI